MTNAEISEKLEAMSGKQGQAVDALCLLLDGLDSEGRTVTVGPGMAENFVGRLRMYMGAFHLIVDTLEEAGEALDTLSTQIDKGGAE